MKTFAIIENGVVVNIAQAEGAWPFAEQQAVELAGCVKAAIGWAYEGGAFIAADTTIPADPTLPRSTIQGSDTTYTFTAGQVLPEHDHTAGGRHVTLIESGSFKVMRNGLESLHAAGDKLYFSVADRHSFKALSAGEIVNTLIPAEVTMRQARLALIDAGLIVGVEGAITAMPEPARTRARTEWEYSGTVQRTKPLVLQLGPALGLSATQLDDLFITAAGL